MSGQILPAAAPLPSSTLPPEKVAKIWQSAKDFEAMALGQLLAPMFDTVDTAHSTFGGGDAEATWQPMLVDAIGKQMAARGGLGLAVPVFNQSGRVVAAVNSSMHVIFRCFQSSSNSLDVRRKSWVNISRHCVTCISCCMNC